LRGCAVERSHQQITLGAGEVHRFDGCAGALRDRAHRRPGEALLLEAVLRADFDAADPAAFPLRESVAVGPARIDFDLRHLFIDPIDRQHRAVRALLADAEREQPGEPVVVLHDTGFLGMWPVLLGAPGVRPQRVIGIGVTPLPLTSIDTAPFGFGLAPDSSEAGRARNRSLNAMVVNDVFAGAQSHLAKTMQALGARATPPFVFDGMVSMPDRYLQMSIAALEYARSDAPAGLRYAGALPFATPAFSPPAWWEDVLGAKQVVAVTQGTLANRDFDDLIQPTLLALADLDVVVVAVTGRADADIGPVPANARVAEFIPFDQLLPHVDVLVSNGGYGGIRQALGAGVPLVVAGESEDKAEVAARAAYTGAAINLATSRPSVAAVRAAVDAVLTDPGYRRQARRLQADYARHDALAAVDACVLELTHLAGTHATQAALA
jgi:UDP:flavonoid glycosyltransferase YjiC (YdhE family)